MTSNSSELVELIFKLSRLMKDNMSFSADFKQLSLLQLQVLVFLKKHEHAKMHEIAQEFHIELPSATSLVNALCKAKLTDRHTDPKDRRLVRIALTQVGKKLLQQAMRERTRKIEISLSPLSKEEKKDLLSIITKMVEHMETNEK